MSTETSQFHISYESNITAEKFISEYLNKSKPIVIPAGFSSSAACQKWNLDYFQKKIPDMKFVAKHLDAMDENSPVIMEDWLMGDYIEALKCFSALSESKKKLNKKPPYCHDIPLFKLKPELIKDTESFPVDFIPEFYQKNWWDYIQFFMSPKGAVSPLHFDSLCTHNLFFQISGVKVFTIFPMKDWNNCYRYNWKWFKVDPENPDLEKYPEYINADPIQVTVHPGDILLLPAGTLHHVRSLEESFSFNIDFHTPNSVIRALSELPSDQPKSVYFYNSLIALGLCLGISPEIIYPRYEEYLYYTGE